MGAYLRGDYSRGGLIRGEGPYQKGLDFTWGLVTNGVFLHAIIILG